MPGAPLRAIVVGGGLAGLTAAHRLERRGAQVVVLEARERAGGALATEHFAGVVTRSAPHLLAIANELSAGDLLAREPLTHAVLPGRRGPRLVGLRTRSALRFQPLGGLRLARLQAVSEWLGARVDPARPDLETRLDDRSVADLCRLYLGRRALVGLIAPLLQSAFGLDARETSRELLFGWLGPAADVELSLARGLPALLGQLTGTLGDLRLGTRADAVLEGGRGVRLASGEVMRADAVVLAVAAREVLRLVAELGHVEREILAACRTSEQHWLALTADPAARPLAPLGWSTDGLAALCDATPPGANAARVLLVRSGAEIDPAELVTRAESLVPGLARLVRARRAYRREGVPVFGVGHFRKVARLFAEAVRRPERRIWLCGDYLVGPDAEARVASGERAAESALAHMRRSVR